MAASCLPSCHSRFTISPYARVVPRPNARTRSKTAPMARRKSSQSGWSCCMNLRSVSSASCNSSCPDLRNAPGSSSWSRSRVRIMSLCAGVVIATTPLPRRRPVSMYRVTASVRACGSRCSCAKCRFTGASISSALTSDWVISEVSLTGRRVGVAHSADNHSFEHLGSPPDGLTRWFERLKAELDPVHDELHRDRAQDQAHEAGEDPHAGLPQTALDQRGGGQHVIADQRSQHD